MGTKAPGAAVLPVADRRSFLRDVARGAAVLTLTLGVGSLLKKGASAEDTVWQIDPHKCTECGKCATHCVLYPSAVKAKHAFDLCGYCDYCTGYFEPNPIGQNIGAENHICPTDAVKRVAVVEPYYEYHIEEPECIGCAKCVSGCRTYGNGSLQLQIDHDLCVDCDSCSINNACPSDAFVKLPKSKPYMIKGEESAWFTGAPYLKN